MGAAMTAVAEGPTFGDLPTLWIHGDEDSVAPLAVTRPVVERVAGPALQQEVYSHARHNIFNETNKDEVLTHVTRFIDEALGG
jgi:alpha-beta hydrolase superfamily lysophospholipase